MRSRPLILLALMVVLPLGTLAWLGARLLGKESELVQQAFSRLQRNRLAEVDGLMQGLLQERERLLLGHRDRLAAPEAEAMREFVRGDPVVRSLLVFDADGRVLFPPPRGPRSQQEQRDILRLEQPIHDRPGVASLPAEDENGPTPDHGWYVWYHGNDLNLIFWQRLGDRVVAAELDRYRLLADFIGSLPAAGAGEEVFELLDARGAPLHRWGDGRGDLVEAARLPLSEPLSAWQLVCRAPAGAATAGRATSASFGLALGLAALALALGALAFVVWREERRALREAEKRVSFVNQVSHELKTPLTNIRMYAELLEEQLGSSDAKSSRHLAVVVAESQRLSRLIDNVLAFGRHQRGALRLRPAPCVVDEVMDKVLQLFRPRLSERGVQVEFERGAGEKVLADADALEQIMGNLLANVEKYAHRGGWAGVRTAQAGGETVIRVADRGPGIPARERERVFEPFVRLSESPSEGAAGAGIGLTIVRELARLHGGEARIADEGPGAVFEVRLRTPPAGAGEKK